MNTYLNYISSCFYILFKINKRFFKKKKYLVNIYSEWFIQVQNADNTLKVFQTKHKVEEVRKLDFHIKSVEEHGLPSQSKHATQETDNHAAT
jgi:hypothetical protein